MAIMNLLDLKPTTISRDLRDKYLLLYGPAKCGKTSFAAQVPDNIIFSFEKGTNFISGVYAIEVEKWAFFKSYLKQLNKPEVKEKYKTVTIDTISIAWSLCESYICSTQNVDTIADIPWGRGYALLKDEFSDALRQISMMGYGIILIAHAKVKTEKIDDDTIIETMAPNIPDRAQDVVNALVDIIGCIKVTPHSDGTADRTLITRSTPYITAGSRLRYLPPEIPFGYKELVSAMNDAIDKQEADGDIVVLKKNENATFSHTYEEAMEEARAQWNRLLDSDDPEGSLEKANSIVEKIMKRPCRISEIKPDQLDLLELIIEELCLI